MTSLPEYKYSSLPTPSSLRVFSLKPGRLRDPLRAQLDAFDPETCPPYEAISYRWGTSEREASLEIVSPHADGYDATKWNLRIPQSLAEALYRFRNADSNRLLWADCICIRQDEDDETHEKSQQVQRMGRIFERATTVLVWLGCEDSEEVVNKAFACLQLLVNVNYEVLRAEEEAWRDLKDPSELSWNGITRPNPDQLHDRLGLPHLGSQEFSALLDFLKNPYFSRAWMLQENLVAKKRVFYMGQRACTGDFLRRAILDIFLRLINTVDPYHVRYLPDEVMMKLVSLVPGRDLRSEEEIGLGQQQTQSFLDILCQRRGAGCQEPSDLIYSLIGVVPDCPPIQVDYRQPFEAVFAECAWKTIQQRGDLAILSMIGDRGASHLPSWVPDWRAQYGGNTGFSYFSDHFYKATGSAKARVKILNNGQTLQASGLYCDIISHIQECPLKMTEWATEQRKAQNKNKDLYSFTNESITWALIRVSCLDRTSVDGRIAEARWNADSKDRLNLVTRGATRSDEGRIQYEGLMMGINRSTYRRPFLATNRGYLGLSFDSARVGDVVVLLLGSEVPLLLRPLQEPGHYTLVCECFIHGLMDGEGLVEARKAAQPEFDHTDTSWLERLQFENSEPPFPTTEFYIH